MLRSMRVPFVFWSILVGLGSGACQKAKSALEEASGFAQLDEATIDVMLQEAEWNVDDIEVLMGFSLTSKFPLDLSENITQSIGVVPDKFKQGADASGKSKAMALLRKVEIVTDVKTYSRFEVASVAKITDDNELYIGGGDIGQYLDEADRVSKANGQEGDYLLVAGREAALSFLTGTVTLKTVDSAAAVPVGGAYVFTDSSPFATKSGSEGGMYLLAMVAGQKGNVIAYKSGMGVTAKGTPESTTEEIPYSGVIPDEKKEQATTKADEFKENGGKEIGNWIDKANEKVTTLLDMWELQPADLVFTQPPQTVAKPATPTPDKAPATPTNEVKADPEPAPTSTVMRVAPDDAATAPQIDLGCTGVTDDAEPKSTLLLDGSKYSDTKVKGWRMQGDVRITQEMHAAIFGAPSAISDDRYLDAMPGYCLLSTGNSQYNNSSDKSALLNPGPDGAGKTSELWQRVKVPAEATSIQMRVAFFSQEYPRFVGTQFNDSFLIKFDESMDVIASGNLNDLAGAKQNVDLTACQQVTSYTKGDDVPACGDWKPVGSKSGLHGELWDIKASTQAPNQGAAYGCLKDGNASGKCFHGFIEPRVICKTLTADEQGKELTLRLSVSDAGDAVFDSALAVDSVVFSTEGCGEKDLFSGDRASQVSEVPASDVGE